MSSSSSGRRQRRRLNNSVTISSAEKVIGDDDLLRLILIRLPAKRLMVFKLVSKRWCSLISDPFVLENWIPPISASSFFLRRYSSPSRITKFNRISLTGFVNKNRRLESFNYVYGVKISQSCKGLLLCSSRFADLYPNCTRYYIVNPTTKEFSIIPRPRNGDDDRNLIVSINLAFDPAVSLHYKIVAVLSKQWHNPNCQIAVYSSETRVWMFSNASFACLGNITFHNGVFFNGKIHWPCCHSEASIYYDLNRHQFSALPMPNCLSMVPMYFGESGGRLRLIEFYQNPASHFDVFELKSDYSEWFVKYRVDLELGVSAFPEMRRMCAGWSTTYVFNVLCFLGGEVEGDLCLIVYIPCKVISYNFKDRSFRKICNLKLSHEDTSEIQGCPWSTIHPCMETMFHV